MDDEPKAAEPPRWQPFVRGETVGATSRYDSQLNTHLGVDAMTPDSNRKG